MLRAAEAIDTLYGLGHWLIEQQRATDAIHVFRTMLMAAPEDERGWLGLGTCHELVGHDAAARDLYALGAAQVPASFRCPLAQARVLRRVDAIDAADVAYEIAVARAEAVDENELARAIEHERLAS